MYYVLWKSSPVMCAVCAVSHSVRAHELSVYYDIRVKQVLDLCTTAPVNNPNSSIADQLVGDRCVQAFTGRGTIYSEWLEHLPCTSKVGGSNPGG